MAATAVPAEMMNPHEFEGLAWLHLRQLLRRERGFRYLGKEQFIMEKYT